jgi:hypothetical protein
MQITLKQDELETAVRSYINTMGMNFEVSTVKFTPTRGSDGIVTEIEIGASASVASAVVTAIDSVVEKVKDVAADVADAVTGEADDVSETDDEEGEVPAGKSLFG